MHNKMGCMMKVEVVYNGPREYPLTKSLLEYNLKLGFKYGESLGESEEFGLGVGLIRFHERYKMIYKELPDGISLRMDDKVTSDITSIMSNMNSSTLVHASSQIEFLKTNNSLYLSMLSYEAQKYREQIWASDKIDVSYGKCFSLAQHLSRICLEKNIPGIVAALPSFHATIVIDGICVDGSWYDGRLFREEDLIEESERRDLDHLSTSDFTLYTLEEFIQYYEKHHST